MASSFPAGEQHRVLELSARKLEVRTHEAKAKDPRQPFAIAVVCHPHPLYGGTMDNKVVHTLSRAYRDSGIHVVRFNFRGVGQSVGEYAHGEGEQEDLALIINWVQGLGLDLPLYLAGFSFGAYVAARFAARLSADEPGQKTAHKGKPLVEHLLLVAPPVNHFDFDSIALLPCPTVIIQGLDDEVVPADEVIRWATSVKALAGRLSPQLFTLEQTSHFFHGKLNELKACVMSAISKG